MFNTKIFEIGAKVKYHDGRVGYVDAVVKLPPKRFYRVSPESGEKFWAVEYSLRRSV